MSTMDQEARRDAIPELSTPGEPIVLVGREPEQEVLSSTLARAFSGHGAVLLISGEAGIGKTSLVNCVVDRASEDGAIVLSGAAYDLSITPPFGPWLDLTSRFPASESLPQLPPLLANPQQLNELDSPETLHTTVTSFLYDLADAAPLVVILEDLHWSDQATLEMLRFVARSIHGHRILMTLTYRDDELTHDHPLYLTLPSLVRETQAVRINPQRLSQCEISILVANSYQLVGADIQRLTGHLHHLTNGNPLFIEEKLRQLELDGALEPDSDGWRLGQISDQAVPELVQQMVTARLTRVRQSTIDAIQIAAVLGQQVALPVWERFLTAEMRETALDEARHTGVLNVSAQAVSFRHALVREAIHETIPVGKRRQYHQDVAKYYLEQSDPDPDVVSWHLRQAGDPRAADWLIRASEQAERRFAWQEAFARNNEALRILRETPGAEHIVAGVLLKSARLLRYTDPHQSSEYLQMARDAALKCGETAIAAAAQFNIGNTLCNLGEISHGLREMSEAVDILTSSPGETERISRWSQTSLSARTSPIQAWLGNLSVTLSSVGRYDEGIKTAERSLQRSLGEIISDTGPASEEDETHSVLDAYEGIAIALSALGIPDDAKIVFDRSHEIHRKLDYGPSQVLLASLELILHHFPYHTEALDQREYLTSMIEAHAKTSSGMVGDENALWGYEHFLAHTGRWQELRELIRSTDPPPLFDYWFVSMCARLRFAWYEGNLELAQALLAELLPEGYDTTPDEMIHMLPAEPHRIAAEMALHSGHIEDARTWMSAHDRWLEWSRATLGLADGTLLWARIRRAEGNADKARELAEQARQRAEDPGQPMALIAIDRFLGELATANGNVDAAADHLHSSLMLAESCQLPFERAQSLLSLTELEIARGNDEHALTAFKESQQISTELGAHPTLERARQLEESLGTKRKDTSYGLSNREREVLSLIIEGLTDRQIAEQLFISHRTVMRHVANILRKLDLDSRTAAAAKAVAEDLI